MNPRHWVPVLAFLVVSIPLVLLLNALHVGGEYRVWIAMAAGSLVAGLAQARLKSRGKDDR